MAVAAAPPALDTPPLSRRQNRRLMLVLGLSLLLSNSTGLAILPLQYLLKDRMHLGATAIAGFFALAAAAWYAKPLAGMLSDSVPLWGTRRRSYLLGSSALVILLWGLLDVLPRRYGPILWAMAGVNAMCVILSSVAGGMIVEAGRRSGLTGRLSVLRTLVLGAAGLAAGPVGGFLAARAFGWTCATEAILFLLLIPAVAWLLPEPRAASRAGAALVDLRRQFGAMRRCRPLWIAAAFLFLDQLSPGFGMPLFFYQTETLKFSSQFIGNLGLIAGLGGVAGVVLYGVLCSRVPLNRMLAGGIVFSAAGSLLYLGYHSQRAALGIEAANAFLSAGVAIALLDLAARATPRGSEALCYSLLMSAANLGVSLANVSGSWLYEKQHVPLPNLIWINAVTSALPLLALPLIPRALMAHPDGGRVQAA